MSALEAVAVIATVFLVIYAIEYCRWKDRINGPR